MPLEDCACLCLGAIPSSFGELHKLFLRYSCREAGQICFPVQIYLSNQNDLETLHTQLDYKAIGNVHLWLSINFHILTLSPHLFSYFCAEMEWLSNWAPMPGHYLKPGGSEPLGSYMKCSGVEKQPEENGIWALSHCSFSLSLSLFLKVFSFLASILRMWYLSCSGKKEAGDGQDQHYAIGVYGTSFLEENIFY